MARPSTLTIQRSVLLLSLCLGGCTSINPTPRPTGVTLPAKLSIEEHALKSRPPTDESGSFEPVEGTQAEILGKHQNERSQRFSNQPMPSKPTISIAGEELRAVTTETNGKIRVEVWRDGETIYAIQVGDSSPYSSLRGFWGYDDHWVLEVAHATEKRNLLQNEIDYEVFGEIIRDRQSLNQQQGYQETFGFQLMDSKPFYFFKKNGRIGIFYDDQEIPLGYSQVPHYGCCSASALNPRVAMNMVSFFAEREATWYYVEVGVFE